MTGGSKNLVLITLRNKGDYDKLEDSEKEKLYTENNDDDNK